MRIAMTLGMVVGTLSISGSARAGGGSWWEWGAAYAPGERVTSTVRTFGAAGRRGDADEGPYFAYLAPKDFWEWEPPGLPPDLLPLGRIEIADSANTSALADATLTFTAPDVRPGEYTVIHCNKPCTHEFGTLMRSPLTITGTVIEARAIRFASRGDNRLWRWVNRLDARMSRQDHRQAGRLKDLRREVVDLRRELRTDLARVTQGPGNAEPAKASMSEAFLVIAAGGVVVLVMMTFSMRRRPGGRRGGGKLNVGR